MTLFWLLEKDIQRNAYNDYRQLDAGEYYAHNWNKKHKEKYGDVVTNDIQRPLFPLNTAAGQSAFERITRPAKQRK